MLTRRQLLGLGVGWPMLRFAYGHDIWLTPEPPALPTVSLVQRPGEWVNAQFTEEVRLSNLTELRRSDLQWVNSPDLAPDPSAWHIASGMRRTPMDNTYWVAETRADLEALVKWTQDYSRWILEFYRMPLAVSDPDERDCEDWVSLIWSLLRWVFRYNSVGLVSDIWSAHSYLLALVAYRSGEPRDYLKGEFFIVEATSGEVFTMEEKDSRYGLLSGQMWF